MPMAIGRKRSVRLQQFRQFFQQLVVIAQCILILRISLVLVGGGDDRENVRGVFRFTGVAADNFGDAGLQPDA